MVTDLPLQVGGLIRHGTGQDAGVAETRPEEHHHHEQEQDAADSWDGRSQVGRQEGTAEDRDRETSPQRCSDAQRCAASTQTEGLAPDSGICPW